MTIIDNKIIDHKNEIINRISDIKALLSAKKRQELKEEAFKDRKTTVSREEIEEFNKNNGDKFNDGLECFDTLENLLSTIMISYGYPGKNNE